jgi:hypothetical protein
MEVCTALRWRYTRCTQACGDDKRALERDLHFIWARWVLAR